VPSIKPEDVEITVADKLLTIRGETKADNEIKEENYHLRERRLGSFTRTIALPQNVDVDQIEAVNEHGALTLTIPKAASVKPKRIEVRKQIQSN